MAVWIVIPAYNEERRIGKTLDNYHKLMKEFDAKIIVVSDSTDGTNAIVLAYSKRWRNVKLIRSTKRLGKGGAVIMGMRRAGLLARENDIVGYLDADASVDANGAMRLLQYMERKGVQAVMASRYIKGAKVVGGLPLKRFIASRAYNLLVRILFGMNYTDTQCGAKFFRVGTMRRFLDKIVITGMSFDVNILYALKMLGVRDAEVPVTYTPEMSYTKVVVGEQMRRMFISLLRYRMQAGRIEKGATKKDKRGL